MFWFVTLLTLTVLIWSVLTLLGRAVIFIFRIQALQGSELEHWLAASIVGTGIVTLFSGWCQYAGLAAIVHRWLLVGIVILLVGIGWWQGRLVGVTRVRSPAAWWAGIAIVVIGVALYLLPVCYQGSHNFISDALLYVPAADWLVQHGFGLSITLEPNVTTSHMIAGLQAINHRMGPLFLHGLFTATVPFFEANELFPVMIGLATILNLAAVYLLLRWCLEIPQPQALGSLLFITLLVHSIVTTTRGAFLCQVYGTAMLAMAVGVMPLITGSSARRVGNAFLIGLLVAFQMSMYSEMVPILALVGAWWVVREYRDARRMGEIRSLLRFFLLSLFFIVLLANIEILRSWQAVQYMLKLDGVGIHISYHWWEYTRLCLGADFYGDWSYTPRAKMAFFGLAILFICGLNVRRGGSFLLATLVVFAGLFVYMATFRDDPWTKEKGHTWNLYKLCQWLFPFVAAAQGAGCAFIWRNLSFSRSMQFLFVLSCCAISYQHLQAERKAAQSLAVDNGKMAGDSSPYDQLRKLHQQFPNLQIQYVIVHPSNSGHIAAALGNCLLSPRRVTVCGGIIEFVDPTAVYLYYQDPRSTPSPFNTLPTELPFHFVQLNLQQPSVLRVEEASKPMTPHIESTLVHEMNCWIFAPQQGPFALNMSLAGSNLDVLRHVTLKHQDKSVVSALDDDGNAIVAQVELFPGVNRIRLSSPLGFFANTVQVTCAKQDSSP